MRDFGTKYTKKSVVQIIKDIDSEDQKIIDEVFAKYGKTPNQEFQSEYPSWFIEKESNKLIDLLYDLITNITTANSIYAYYVSEFELRRKYQDLALANCYVLFQELLYIGNTLSLDWNHITRILDMLEDEVDKLKGWRQSDNKQRKKAQERENKERMGNDKSDSKDNSNKSESTSKNKEGNAEKDKPSKQKSIDKNKENNK